MTTRRTASFGVPYNYSGISYPETPLPGVLRPMIDRLAIQLGIRFNNCLLNHYQSGENTMGFHSDDTSCLLPETGVAIVSLGSEREITFRSKNDSSVNYSVTMLPGMLLSMDNEVQEKWLHGIQRAADVGPRISLTWRAFQTS